jgi:hypothetical protein
MQIIKIRRTITAILLFSFITVGFIDALLHHQVTYSSIMGMDIVRVYFYTFFLLVIGCWLLYNKYLVGIGFITLATFSSYFLEYLSLHNYFASVVVYIGLLIDLLVKRKYYWIIVFIILGILQGISFQYIKYTNYVVGSMELISLCIGSIFIVRNI